MGAREVGQFLHDTLLHLVSGLVGESDGENTAETVGDLARISQTPFTTPVLILYSDKKPYELFCERESLTGARGGTLELKHNGDRKCQNFVL